MQIKRYFGTLIGLAVVLSCRCSSHMGRQMPQPHISALKDDAGTLPVCDDYLPAAMQCLQHYTEMMQYELVQSDAVNQPTTKRPITTTTTKPTTTTTRRTTTKTTRRTTTQRTTTQRPTTTQKPVTTTRKTTVQQDPWITEINLNIDHPTTARPHKPGNVAPEKPPYWIYFGMPVKPEQGYFKPQEGINTISDPDWNNPTFIQWFFQPKPKETRISDDADLQYLDPLPRRLLLDLDGDENRPPALLDLDNVNEFLKRYDDYFYPNYQKVVPNMQHMRMKMNFEMKQQQRLTVTGRKKPPPTRPYVHMIMLYDLLKREAKSKKLHNCGGFSNELLEDLNESSQKTGDEQMKYLLEKMLELNEVSAADVLTRTKFIISDLNDEKSDTFKTLRKIPPLVYSL